MASITDDDIQELLDFGTIEVFYIVCNKHNRIYYMSDMTPDTRHIRWTRSRHNAIYFYIEKEGMKHLTQIKKLRKDVALISGEIEVGDDFDADLP